MKVKAHKKSSPGSILTGSTENYAKQMISFIQNKNETSKRTIFQLFDTMSQIDLTKISISKIKNPTILYIKTLKELMERINNNKIVFRPTQVVLCAQMIAETARIFSQSSGINIDIFHILLSNEKIIMLPSESDIPPFPVRKIQKIHSYSPLLAFIIKHYPQASNITDFFSYALVTMLERMKLKFLIPRIIPSFPPEKYTPVSQVDIFDCAEATPESLLEVVKKLKSPIDPILMLLARFISNKIFGSYDFNYIKVSELLDTAFEFLEEDSDFNIDSLIPLLLYYSSIQVNFPIHLTYTSVNHCLFFICIGLRGLFEPTTNDILLSTISFENAPCPSLALVFAHNLSASFIPDFISHALKNDLSPEWNEEIQYLLQYVKLPPKREDLIEQSKTNNLDAIKLLLKDPECISLLKPDEYQSHKLLSLFLKPVESPLPQKISFDRYDAAFIYHLRSLKDQPDQEIISNYIRQAAEILTKITLNICNNDKSLFHAIYSGLQPALSSFETLDQPFPPPLELKKISGPEFFFSPPISPEFENISIIIDNLIHIIFTWKFNFDNNQEIIRIVADFNHHYYLSLNHSHRCSQLFDTKYKEIYEMQPFDHFIAAYREDSSKNKQTKLIYMFKPIICAPTSQACILYFIQKCYELNDQESFIKIIKLMPNIISLESSPISNEELLDIIKILIYADISKNVIQISTKLIENGFSKQVFQLFLKASFDHPEVMTSICHNLSNSTEFAEYFFNNSLDVIPNEISFDLSNLILLLSRQIKPSNYEIPNYPKLKINNIEWKEDTIKKNKGLISEINPRTELGEEISISVKKEAKTNKNNKVKKDRKYNDDLFEEEEEEEEDFIDDALDNSITITSSDFTDQNKNHEFPFSSKNCPSIWEIPNLKQCTFIETGKEYVDQPFFRCLTCGFSSNEGVCEYCAIHCHKGHQIYFESTQSCYCDCFADPSRCISNPDHKNFAHCSHHHPTHLHNHTNTFGNSSHFGLSASAARPSKNIISSTSSNSNNNNRNDKVKITLSSKCAIDIFLKIARTRFAKFEIDNINTLQLKQLKSVKGFNQFNLSPNFAFPQTPSYSQLRKRISRVKNLSYLLDKRSNYKPISLVCNIGNDVICYSNGSGLNVIKMPQKSVPRSGFFGSQSSSSSTMVSSLPFEESIYSIVSSGDSLVACLCDSIVKIVKITNETTNPPTDQQNSEQQFVADQIRQLQQVENPTEFQTQQLERLLRIQNLHQQLRDNRNNRNQAQTNEINNLQQQIDQLQQQIQETSQNQPPPFSQIQLLSQLRQRINLIQSQIRPENQNQSQNQQKFKLEVIASMKSHQSIQSTTSSPSPSSSSTTSTATTSSSFAAAPAFSFSTSSSSSSSASPQRSSIFIDALFVDNSLILILTGTSITSYSLPSGVQVSRVRSNRISFTSICLFNHKEKKYVLAGNSEGQLIVYLITEQGNLSLDHIVGIDRPSSPVVVSSSNEDDLIFISSDKQPLAICRPSGLFSASLSPIQIDGLTSSVTFTGRYKEKPQENQAQESQDNNNNGGDGDKKDPAVFLFTKTKNGSVCSVEFTSSSFVVASLNDEFRPEDSSQPAYLGSFNSLSGGFYSLSSDGVFLSVSLNEDRSKMLRSQSMASDSQAQFGSLNDLSQQMSGRLPEDNVPLTFWSRTISSNSSDFVNLYANEMDDASNLLDGQTINVPQSLTLRFTAKPIDNDFTIVGIRIFTMMSSSSSSQRFAEFNGRTYQLNGGQVPTCIALRPSEVHPGSPVSFTILPGGGMMILRLIKIHCMRTDELTIPRIPQPKKNFDWMTESTDLLDFCENSLEKVPKDDQKAQIELNLARGFSDDGTIEEDYIRKIIVTMYECGDDIALQSRLILAKLKFDHAVLHKIWADSIGEVVEKKSLHQSQINALWRDFTLIDSNYRGEIQNLVWNNIKQQSGLSCLLSAFY